MCHCVFTTPLLHSKAISPNSASRGIKNLNVLGIVKSTHSEPPSKVGKLLAEIANGNSLIDYINLDKLQGDKTRTQQFTYKLAHIE